MRCLAVLLLAGCEPALDQRLDIVDQPRLLAVVSEPPETKPGDIATYSALIASPTGPIATLPTWDFCIAPKPPTEDDVVSQDCLGDEDLVALGTTATATGALPAKGCSLFGPDTPPGGFRPRDPDPTGGFYQPVRIETTDIVGIGLTRIVCNLADAPTDAAHEYQTMYVPNANPVLLPTTLPATVDAGSDLPITAAWPAASAESYLYFDPAQQVLITRREAMRASWFATAGAFPVDASAVDEDDTATSVNTTWHAPTSAGHVFLWLVLRDSRGGAATQQLELDVR